MHLGQNIANSSYLVQKILEVSHHQLATFRHLLSHHIDGKKLWKLFELHPDCGYYASLRAYLVKASQVLNSPLEGPITEAVEEVALVVDGDCGLEVTLILEVQLQ